MTLLKANFMQIQLMKESDLEPQEWITKYAKAFREAINMGIEEYEILKKILYKKTN
jgi:hypothetical protein